MPSQYNAVHPAPPWKYVVDGFKAVIEPYGEEHDDPIKVRDGIVKVLKASQWYKDSDEYGDLHDAVDELEYLESESDIDYILSRIYDIADDERAWLD